MTTVLEITQLDNGDIVLREADEEQGEPLVRISFSGEVKDMLGPELISVAEAMIDAATEFLEGEPQSLEHEFEDDVPGLDRGGQPPVIH